MPKLPRITGRELVRALEKAGFEQFRQKGSHIQMRRLEPDGTVRTFPVPLHTGKTVKPGTLKGILRKAGMTAKDLQNLM